MKISLKDFRAFQDTGMIDVRPLTFLVGENSSGKTSLMAALSYIWRLDGRSIASSFNTPPFDLGTFDEIVHRVRGRTRPDNFTIEVTENIIVDPSRIRMYATKSKTERTSGQVTLTLYFSNNVGDAKISYLNLNYKGLTLEVRTKNKLQVNVIDEYENVIFDSNNGTIDLDIARGVTRLDAFEISDLGYILRRLILDRTVKENNSDERVNEKLALLAASYDRLTLSFPRAVFASAPVRSNPSRVYTPTDQVRTPDGTHTPQRLFKIKESDNDRWERIKAGLENFGRESGMFTAINVARYRSSGSSPFQINITRNGKQSNIMDVGYGVSQALPILTDLIESPQRSGFLFQQPEVHLHPQAQAALGSFFVDFLNTHTGSFIVAETHSDYLIDRVRLAIKQKIISNRMVSLLYFETIGTQTKIRRVEIDEDGDIKSQPDSYRHFFIREQMRLLGIDE